MISKALTKISAGYIEAKTGSMKTSALAAFIRSTSKEIIKPKVKKNKEHFNYRSSCGQHANWADVPWIAVLDPEITTSTMRGYYVVFLFSIDMKRIYLSLNQGMTDIEKELDTEGAAKELLRRAEFIRDRIPEYKKLFKYEPLDLSISLAGNTTRPYLYEKGHAFGKEYDLSKDLNENEIIEDLNNILSFYSLLIYRGGIDSDFPSDDYKPSEGITTLKELRQYGTHRRIERAYSNSKKVKKILGYTCEACGFNFKKRYGKLSLNKKKEEFIEAHHKKQIQDLPEGKIVEFKIDDFSVLCSNCHRMVHRKNPPYTIEQIKEKMKIRRK